ncbi:MAG: hypothetical protein H0T51_16295 [Pirellulales bacterium]|nr:hypothetical protein [Pirellulales bacterium]
MAESSCERCGYERAERVFVCRLCWALLPRELREAWALAHAAGRTEKKLLIAAQVSEWAKDGARVHAAWRNRKQEAV